MKKRLILFSLALFSVSAVCCEKIEQEKVYEPSTVIGEKLLKENCVATVYNDTTFVIANGVEETDLQLQMMDGYAEMIHIVKVNTNIPGVALKVAMPYNSNNIEGGWLKQTLTDMCGYMDKEHARAVAMINGDFWDTSTPIKPLGPVHREGQIVSSVFNYSSNLAQQALAFVGVNTEGKMIIADREEYNSYKKDLVECTGAGFIFLKKGQIMSTTWTARDPRTAIGYTSNGIVYLLVADGRKTFGAAGLTYNHMANIFKSLGCDFAANLDGGGSAQLAIRHPIALVYQIRNSPSDGAERPVVNGWTVVVDEF